MYVFKHIKNFKLFETESIAVDMYNNGAGGSFSRWKNEHPGMEFEEEVKHNNVAIIDNITNEEDKQIAIDIVAKQFEENLSYEESVEYLEESVTFEISKIAKNKDTGEVMGVMLFGVSMIHELMENETYKVIKDVDLTGKGLEGVALVILEKYRRTHLIYELYTSIESMKSDYDFITIQQYDGMHNTMNYFNKFTKIGSFIEDDNVVSVFYKQMK